MRLLALLFLMHAQHSTTSVTWVSAACNQPRGERTGDVNRWRFAMKMLTCIEGSLPQVSCGL